MPTVDCDPAVARRRLEEAGVEPETGNTDHERWRASYEGATIVAYEETVLVQGATPGRAVALLRGGADRAYLYFDGACRGNPGPAAAGYVVVSGDGLIAENGRRVGRMTNNQAEYAALIAGLEAATGASIAELQVHGDSELVVKQLRGEYQTRDPELQERRVRALELLEGFDSWSIDHIPREINERADELANAALDAAE